VNKARGVRLRKGEETTWPLTSPLPFFYLSLAIRAQSRSHGLVQSNMVATGVKDLRLSCRHVGLQKTMGTSLIRAFSKTSPAIPVFLHFRDKNATVPPGMR